MFSKDFLTKRQNWLENWDPEDSNWNSKNSKIALRNLIFSIFSEHIGFSVWLLWSIAAISLNEGGFNLSAKQLFWLVSTPSLIGAFMRLPYTYAVTRFGGRNWTVISSLLLLLPCLSFVFAVKNPGTPDWLLLLIAASAGLGGGNFASSMANINFFYPERCKGLVLGINAAGGNLGVSSVQILAPFLITITGILQLQNPGYFYAGLALLSAILAWLFMDNLAVSRASFAQQFEVIKLKHTWIMSLLYIGTFGSFIGYSAAMPLLIKTQFPEISVSHYAFIGALLGAICRPIGGWLADKIGGGRLTFWVFMLMTVMVSVAIASLNIHNFVLFLTSFILLFILAGLGNGSTYRMIPAISQYQALTIADNKNIGKKSRMNARIESSAVMGITSSIGAFGGFLIPLSYGCLGIISAFYLFMAFYCFCLFMTWWYYTRKCFLIQRVKNLSAAKI